MFGEDLRVCWSETKAYIVIRIPVWLYGFEYDPCKTSSTTPLLVFTFLPELVGSHLTFSDLTKYVLYTLKSQPEIVVE